MEVPQQRVVGSISPWACQSVHEQDTQPVIDPDKLVGALHGSQLPLVCEWMCEWEASILQRFG